MTCIAAVVDKGAVYMGCDSAATYPNFDAISITSSKLFPLLGGKIQIGVCGSGRVQDVLEFNLKLPARLPSPEGLRRWMVLEFIPRIRLVFREAGMTRVKNEIESYDGAMLIALKGNVFLLESDFQVEQDSLPFMAIGSGGPFARGSLFSTRNLEMDPEARLSIALEAAERYNAGVKRPFKYVKVS